MGSLCHEVAKLQADRAQLEDLLAQVLHPSAAQTALHVALHVVGMEGPVCMPVMGSVGFTRSMQPRPV